jgi:hypothetical protein
MGRCPPENAGNMRNMETGIRCQNCLTAFSVSRENRPEPRHSPPSDTGIVFLLPNATIFRDLSTETGRFPAGFCRKVPEYVGIWKWKYDVRIRRSAMACFCPVPSGNGKNRSLDSDTVFLLQCSDDFQSFFDRNWSVCLYLGK